MLFNSPVFIFLFLPTVALIYFALNRRRWVGGGKAWLVLASLAFYGYWKPIYLPLIVASMLVNFGLGAAFHRTRRSGAHGTWQRKALLIVGVTLNLGLLGYFKYADFFIENVNQVLGTGMPLLHLPLPLAISFFTFQQVAYLVDCYQKDTQEYDFLNYCLFVTFFPQLIAGPIVHHAQVMPQFRRLRNALPNANNLARGLFIFFMGLAKKAFVADTFAVWANAGFSAPEGQSFLQAWSTCLSYTFQLYYDFAGYSDMAIGGALMLNIRLPINFNSPYKATSIRDFWRRWHITLSTWLRDYLYIPLGGNRRGPARTHVNLFLTFLLGGLWHGAGWTFVIWGALHGVGLIVHRAWNQRGHQLPALAGWALTFVFAAFAWVFFRAEGFGDAIALLRGMLGVNGFGASLASPMPADGLPFLALFALAAFLAPNTVQMIGFEPYQGRLRFKTGGWYGAFAGAAAAIGVTYMLLTETSEFLYFNF